MIVLPSYDAIRPIAIITLENQNIGATIAQLPDFRTEPSAIFADNGVWTIGQSIKDAAKQKPTYIIEHATSLKVPL